MHMVLYDHFSNLVDMETIDRHDHTCVAYTRNQKDKNYLVQKKLLKSKFGFSAVLEGYVIENMKLVEIASGYLATI